MKPPLCDEFVACAGFFFQFDFNSLGYRFRFKSPPSLDDSFQRIWWPTRSELRIEHQVCGFSSQKIRSDFGSIGHYTDLAQFLFDLRRLLEETRPHSVVYFGAPSVQVGAVLCIIFPLAHPPLLATGSRTFSVIFLSTKSVLSPTRGTRFDSGRNEIRC